MTLAGAVRLARGTSAVGCLDHRCVARAHLAADGLRARSDERRRSRGPDRGSGKNGAELTGLTILALPGGVIPHVREVSVVYHGSWDTRRDLPIIMFVIVGGDHPIIVDTGAPEPTLVNRHYDPTFRRSPDHEPHRVLEDAGINPADVRQVVLTHLHWSHCGNVQLFPNARFYVQDDELRYAISPISLHRSAYGRSSDVNPSWLPVLDRVETIRGAVQIAPGVSTVPLPGHTPGSQGALVETASGRFLIAGDCLNSYDNWKGNATLDHIPSSSFTNLIDYTESFERIDSLKCDVIPSHDQRVLDQAVFG